jgi:hypothetical protein
MEDSLNEGKLEDVWMKITKKTGKTINNGEGK